MAGLPLRVPARAEGSSSVGALTLDGCLNSDGSRNCGDLPPAGAAGPLTGARAVAVRPDGGSVYVVSQTADSISHFARAQTGQLTFAGCLSNDGTGGQCVDLPPAGAAGPLEGATGVVVRPDGGSVYVVSLAGNSVAHFAVATAGQLTYAGCVANDPALAGCTDLPPAGANGPLAAASGVAVRPDGGSLYVAAGGSDSVSHFTLAAPGQLTFAGCVANDPADAGCTDLPPAGANGPLDGAGAVAVRPDAGSLYVVSFASNSVSHFTLAAPGQLTFARCVANNPAPAGCTDLAPTGVGGPLDGAFDVAVSPNGGSAYVVSEGGDSLTHFFLAAAGQLTLDGCLSNDGSQNCGDLPPAGAGGPLDSPRAVRVSPDGLSVYVASAVSDSVTQFARVDGGQVSLVRCLNNDGSQGCTDLAPAGALGPLQLVTGLAIGPAGDSLYTAAFGANAVAHFFRALPSTTPAPPAPPVPSPPPSGSTVRCQGKLATIVGTAAGDRLTGTPGADVIAALGGDDTVEARGGDDLVCGGAGNDRLGGGVGADRMFGGAGADTVRGGPGADAIFGGPGIDDLRGGPDTDRCTGGPLADRSRACETTRSI